MSIWQKYGTVIDLNCISPSIGKNNLEYWRNSLFSATLAFIIPLALLAVIPGVVVAYNTNVYPIIVVDIAAMVGVLAAAFAPGLPVYVRKILFTISLYAVSIALLYYLGLFGPGLLYLLALSVFIVFIFDYQFAVFSVVVNSIICILFGLAIYYEWGNSALVEQYTVDTWIAVTANFLFLNIVAALLIPKLFNGLQQAIINQEMLTKSLEEKQNSLEHSMSLLKAKNEELEDFAYSASHDLKEPLRMVKSFLGLLEKKYKNKLDEKADQYIHYAVDGATRMQYLIEDLLEYSRVGRYNTQFLSISTNDVVQTAIRNLKTQIEESGANIEVSENLPILHASENEMIRVFQNLISNAIKFRNDAQIPVITIGGESKNKQHTIWVKDNGIGIEQDKLDEVFDIFKRLNSQEKYPGTGIGLAICRKIVERHNGSIYVTSEPGKGSTFFLEFRSN
ncbi:MAG: GHKL domain-containing protein [Balneolaceae bacterium]|nr:MAG: GHKL domain-containing protein [Balneolaceae bacterium]